MWLDLGEGVIGEFTKTKYFGRFLIKPFLSNEEKTDVSRIATVYNRGIDDPDRRMFTLTVAFLKMHVQETDAAWWSEKAGNDLLDESPIYGIAKLVNQAQTTVVAAVAP
jgi:hypothetical protein